MAAWIQTIFSVAAIFATWFLTRTTMRHSIAVNQLLGIEADNEKVYATVRHCDQLLEVTNEVMLACEAEIQDTLKERLRAFNDMRQIICTAPRHEHPVSQCALHVYNFIVAAKAFDQLQMESM